MSTIVTRAGKGSPLTHTEVDNNFTNLNTDKLQSGDTVSSLTITSADINGGTIDGATIGASTASTGAFTTATASTSFTSPVFKATNSAGGALQNSSGTNQLQWGGGGGNNLSVDVAININPANAQVAISPTGTGSVTINPATAGTINNMSIGATTASTGAFTNLSVTGTTSFDGSQGTAGQVLTSAGSGNTPTWTTVDALPSQTGNSGKYLTTNGTDASWNSLAASATTDTTNASNISSGTLAKARLPAGSILQVVTDKKTTAFSTSSQNVFVTTSQSLSITPTSTSSRILVMFNAGSVTTLVANTAINVEVRRSGTQYAKGGYYTATVGGNQSVPFGTIHGIDSPNTTSSITYEVFAAEGGIPGTVSLNEDRVLTLMEIAG